MNTEKEIPSSERLESQESICESTSTSDDTSLTDHNDSFNSFQNMFSITCPGCEESIKPVFIPVPSHNQSGGGPSHKLSSSNNNLFSLLQLGAGYPKKRHGSYKKKKSVKRNKPKSKSKKGKKKSTKKSGKTKKTKKGKSK